MEPEFKTASTSLPYTIKQPSMNRIVVPDGVSIGSTVEATADNVTAAKIFAADLIGKARRLAQADELTAVQPIRIDGRETYVMVIDPYQARDLRKLQRGGNSGLHKLRDKIYPANNSESAPRTADV